MTDARHAAYRIGLTGPIGCGKSTIARWLGERPGVLVIDADLVARDVLAPGTAEATAVVGRFGPSILDTDGALDREALGRIVFADPAALRDLETIVHPAVRGRIHDILGDADRGVVDVVVIEAIKLVEGGLADLCDEVWLVTCAPDIQLARLVGRGSSVDDADRRIAAQAGIRERIAGAATRIVDTSDEAAATRRVVDVALDEILAVARDSGSPTLGDGSGSG